MEVENRGGGGMAKANEIIKKAMEAAAKNKNDRTYFAFLSGVLMNEIKKLCKEVENGQSKK